MNATFTKTQEAQKQGTYKTTAIDSVKTNVDFRLTQVAPNYIVWKDEKSEIVTSAKLKKLQSQFSWVTDF